MKVLGLLLIVLLVFSASAHAQNPVQVQLKSNQKWPSSEARTLYLAACSAVQREFAAARPPRPQITVVLGADKNEAFMEHREIRLTKWNPDLFTEGVVLFAFEELMPIEERLAVTHRALQSANSTVDVNAISK